MRNKHKTLAPLAVSENIVMQELDTEILIYNLQTHQAMSLNETVACVWQLCDGQKTIDQIKNETSQLLKTEVSDDLIFLALDELAKNELLAEQSFDRLPNSRTNGIPRRELIRRAALSTAVALPLITGLAAPIAAQAASTLLPDGSVCNQDDTVCRSQCCFNNVCSPPDACFAFRRSTGK